MAAVGGAGTAPRLLMIDEPEEFPNLGSAETYNIGEGETMEHREVGPYVVHVIQNKEGVSQRVRKITPVHGRPGQFLSTVREADVYDKLREQPDWKDHILPFYKSQRSRDWIYINFRYVDGEDFEQYMKKNPTLHKSEKKTLLLEAIWHLRWLLQAGYTHGDVKLSNFYRDTTGKTYILDFGTARQPLSTVGILVDIYNVLSLFPDVISDSLRTELKASVETSVTTGSSREKGLAMYDALLARVTTLEVRGGSRHRTHRRLRRNRKTYKSMPRIIR